MSKDQNLSNYRANHNRELATFSSQTWTDGIHEVILDSFSQTSEEQKEKQSLFSLKTMWRDTNENQ